MASTYGNKWTWVTVYCIFVYEIASTVGLCVGIIALQYSYCIVTPVKVTKGTSAHPAADVADESLRFYFLERERRGGKGWRYGNRHKHGNKNKLQPLGFYHPPSPLLCICLHLQWTLLFILLYTINIMFYLCSDPVPSYCWWLLRSGMLVLFLRQPPSLLPPPPSAFTSTSSSSSLPEGKLFKILFCLYVRYTEGRLH